MDERAGINGRANADSEVFSSHSLDVAFSQKTRITAHKHLHVLRTKDGARVSIILVTKVIFMFSRVASLGRYTFRIQNPYLFIDCSLENGIIVVVLWRGGE